MITRDQVIPLFFEAFPGCKAAVEQEREHLGEALLYCELGVIADCLVTLLHQEKTEEFFRIFTLIEHLCREGDDYVNNAIVIGLLEGMQNIAGNRGIAPDLFRPFLLQETAYWWDEINDFWDGKGIIGTNRLK